MGSGRVGCPGWQFLAFLCPGEKLPRWTYLARNCWNLSSSARLAWVEFCERKFLSFPLSGCKLLWSSVEFPGWKFLAVLLLLLGIPFLEFTGFADLPLSAEKFSRWSFLGGVSWLAIPRFPLSWLKLPRWTYLARKCWIYSSSASLAWVEFYEWKFLSVPLSGCKLLRWCFLGGSSLQWSCSYLQFPFWNLRDLMASIFLQRNFLGGVAGWGILAGNSFLVFVLEPNPRWSFLGLSLFFAFRIIQTRLMRLSVVHGLNSSQKLKAIFGRLCQS